MNSEPKRDRLASSQPLYPPLDGRTTKHRDTWIKKPHGAHGGHGLMMIVCCIPMLIVVGILVATGVAGSGAILYAVVCLGMMAMMMFAMSREHRR